MRYNVYGIKMPDGSFVFVGIVQAGDARPIREHVRDAVSGSMLPYHRWMRVAWEAGEDIVFHTFHKGLTALEADTHARSLRKLLDCLYMTPHKPRKRQERVDKALADGLALQKAHTKARQAVVNRVLAERKGWERVLNKVTRSVPVVSAKYRTRGDKRAR